MKGKNESNTERIDVLIVDQCTDYVDLLKRHLLNAGLATRIEHLQDLPAIRSSLEERQWHLIVCDHQLEQFAATDVLELLRELGQAETPFIVMADQVDTQTALQSLRDGADDFIFKDDLTPLVQVIESQISAADIRRERSLAESKLRASNQKLELTLQSLAATQNQLVAAERFRAHGQISSGIAHDFNNSLTKMLSTTGLLRDKNPEEQGPLISKLESQIDDAAAVVRRLCDLYRKNPENVETVVDISEVLEDTFEKNRDLCLAAADIKMVVRSESHASIWGDAIQLGRALNKLVSNACDAMRETGGLIELISRRVNNTVQLEIRDNGPGMTDSVLKRCMEPLFTTKGSAGTGLGLSIVEGIIQSFGGTCRVSSQKGEGTSVYIELRCAQQSDPPSRATTAPAENPKKLRVLVVDDEPAINAMVERGLQHFGHETQSKVNPIEALELFESQNFDLVVSDRSMPEMSGDTFALQLRERHPNTRFVMVSGYGDLMLANGELPEGVDIVLSKPTPPDRLNEVMLSLFPEEELVVAS